jgi:hypothetical protein
MSKMTDFEKQQEYIKYLIKVHEASLEIATSVADKAHHSRRIIALREQLENNQLYVRAYEKDLKGAHGK